MAIEHFHPEIEPYRTGHLQVDDLHTLYYEECGTPSGLPMLFVHGGPGAGCSTTDRRFLARIGSARCCLTSAAAVGPRRQAS